MTALRLGGTYGLPKCYSAFGFVTACLHYRFYLINMDAVAVRQSATVPATVKLLVSLLILESMIVCVNACVTCTVHVNPLVTCQW